MNFIAAIFAKALPAILSWVAGSVSRGISFLVDLFGLKKDQKQNQTQAQIVEDLATEVKKLALAGQPVPEELKEKLRNASRKLIRDSTLNVVK